NASPPSKLAIFRVVSSEFWRVRARVEIMPTDMTRAKTLAAAKFRAMHESGCFVLPNPWDIGTAIYLERVGFKALATTSAGFAFSRGKPDGGVPRDEMLAHIREIVEATTLPVNADFLNSFADNPEDVAANVRLCVETG